MDPQIDICADCSAPSPQWASVNRGVLLCDECSSIHRQLGRHISQIKHLKKSRWRPSQLEMMHSLVSACANRYWEHVLFEPMLHAASSRLGNSSVGTSADGKKPRPNDPTYPNKADFIREKYLFLGFFKKPKSVYREDLNRQLHASVRTGVLETSLYLLALGANPNFVNLDKGGTSPLHVACQHGQIGQVELLLAYGADVCLRDHRGSTPVDVALEKILSKGGDFWRPPAEPPPGAEQHPLRTPWSPLVTALVEAYYEIPDSLAYFLSRRVPDHRMASPLAGVGSGGHFLVATPFLQALRCNDSTTSTGGPPDSSWAVEARRRLTQLPGPAFEDLCVDVYDEADRRITNSFLESADTLVNATNRSPGRPTATAVTTNGFHSLSPSVPGSSSEGRAAAANRGLTLFFLPPNTSYSSVRNQARQKLGRLSTVELHTLVLDLVTEISARLLPLLPPMLWSQITAAPATATAAAQPSGVSVVGRNLMAPLPRPPVTGDLATEAATDNSPPAVSSISSCNSSPEALDRVDNYSGKLDLQEAKPSAVANDTGGGPKRHGDRFGGGGRRSRDDPVYDQVAGELELQPSPQPVGSAEVISRSLRTLTDEGPPGVEATPPNPTLRSPLTVDTAEVESRGLARNPSSVSPCTPTSVSADAPGVTSSPGQLPGSRRLHLAHVGRPSDHRASVPAVLASQHSGLTFKMESAGLSRESTTAGDLAISTLGKRWTGERLDEVPACSDEVVGEVERLREENRRLLSRVVELESANEAGESRRLKLESRLKELDTTVGLLKEEKSALLAAFSAGMVLSHPAPRSSESPRQGCSESGFSSSSDAKEKTAAEALRCDRRPLPMVADLPEDDVSDDEGEREHVEDMDEEDEAGGAEYNKAGEATGSMSNDTGADGGNYSLGSDCLSSGILFRQGIVLRSGSSRVLSTAAPPTSHPVGRAFPNTGGISGAACVPVRERPGAPTMTYVNVPPPPRALLAGGGKSAAAAVVSTTTAIKMVGCPSAETSSGGGGSGGGRADTSNYAMPTSTGSASPHPPTSSTSTTNPALLPTTSAVESSSHRGTAAADSQTSVHRVRQLQQQHAQILASIASLPDYENDAGSSGGGGATAAAQVYRPSADLPPVAASGKGMPSPERVLRCVEAIIVHIRSLVELANSKRLEEATNCALLIYSAVKETLALFPDDRSACQPSVAQPLAELMSVSRQLVTIKATTAMSSAASIPCCSDINLLIRYAHQIAKAAKQLLAMFQRVA